MFIKALVSVLFFAFPLVSAATYQCSYAVAVDLGWFSKSNLKGVVEEFKADSQIEAPKMISDTKCGTPICVASLACLRYGHPTAVTTAVCKAVQKDGKWICPKAQICFDDADVKHDEKTLPDSEDLEAMAQHQEKTDAGTGAGGTDGGKKE